MTHRRLKEIIVSMTNRCNLRCKMCHIPRNETAQMSNQEMRALIKGASALGPESIVFSGGEPLVRKDIFELISFARKCGMNTCLTSNGTLIDSECARKLAESGIGVVNISIDGNRQVHDNLRGKGNFEKAVNALKHLAAHKIEATVASTVTRQTYKTLPAVMDLARQYGVTTVKFQPFNPIFLSPSTDISEFVCGSDIMTDMLRSMEKIMKLAEKYKIATNPPQYLLNIPAYLCAGQKTRQVHDCPALWGSCPISGDGNVYLCWVLADRVIGNVKTDPIEKIWNSPAHQKIRAEVAKNGCPGCMMSCYDYNFGNYANTFTLGKLAKPGFYRRRILRLHQYSRYISGKIINRLVQIILAHCKSDSEYDEALVKLKLAQSMLKRRLEELQNNE